MIQLTQNCPEAYKNVLKSYQKFCIDPQLDESQKGFFTSLSGLFPIIGMQTPTALERGVHYREALLLRQGKSFNKFPQSREKLQPLAEDYCDTVSEICSLLQNPPKRPELLKEKLGQLGFDHLRFRKLFTEELLKVCADTTAVIRLNYLLSLDRG